MQLPRAKPRARVEMLPLLDIVFLILVFFIYAMLTMNVDKAMPLNLPVSNAAKPLQQEALSLSISADGSLFLDKRPITDLELSQELHTLAAVVPEEGPELLVKVFADASLDYQSLYRVLDLLNQAGVKSISLQAGPGALPSDTPAGAAPGAAAHE